MTAMADQLVRAVLYEGYALYPYRPSALKNQKRFAFGVIYPRGWAERTLDASLLRVELIVEAAHVPAITSQLRFLRLRRGGGGREVSIDVQTGRVELDGLVLDLEATTTQLDDRLWKHAIEIRNETPLDAVDHEAAMDVSPASTHLVSTIEDAVFISAIDPPAHARAAVAGCRSTGLYPILVGDGSMLASPIILPDCPEIAPQSPGDFFDGTEIDEMLTLRVLTMTDDEKREAAAADPKIAAMIARTEALGIANTANLHGVLRSSFPMAGMRVRVRATMPVATARRTDAMDIMLAGKLATVAGVERDLEGAVYCAITLDDDPGADLGVAGMPGHRFYFRPDELEVL